MSKQHESKVIPRLRFPEFQGSAEWTLNELAAVANFINDKIAVTKLHLRDYISTENLLPDYGEPVVSSKLPDVASVTSYERNDVLISNIRPYLKKVWRADRNGGASNDVIVVRAKPVLSEAFLSLILRNDAFIAYVMESAKGVKMPRGDVNVIREYAVAYPETGEQQKITECLTSLDQVIAAQGRKVEVLKAHKLGLMQQLFPREGETRPRLRFLKFRDAPEWEETTIGKIGKFYYGKSAPKWSLEANAPTRCVRYGELYTKFGAMITETFSRTNIDPKNLRFSKGGEILIPRVGEKPEDFGRCCCYLPLANIAIGEMISVFETAQIPLFYTYYFRNLYRQFAKVVEGQNVKNLYYTELEPLAICRPPVKEQREIADCLSALDTQIIAEANWLGSLKTHKRGLMQQLFPVLEGG